jgi:diguanylate cyclase (GGDEF)-like protein
VNDSKFETMILVNILKKNGFSSITTATSAKQALSQMGIVCATSYPHNLPDIILMNLILPEMDGIEACQHIKNTPTLRDLPIIIMTSTDRDDLIRKAFQAGATDFVSTPIREVELISRIETAYRLKQEMDRRIAREKELMRVMLELDKVNKRLKELSFVDGLTGVYNRRFFEETLNEEWQHAIRHQFPLSLILLDIDYFKRYNDYYGHFLGDECLKQVAQAIKGSVHREGDIVARYGGEEFVVVLPKSSEEVASKIAHRLQLNIHGLHIAHADSDAHPTVTISVGYSTLVPQVGMDTGQLISEADKALYQAKRQGRNQVCTYTP